MDASKALEIIVKYIRGDINLENTAKNLEIIGLDKKSILKILRDTPRDNIIKLR